MPAWATRLRLNFARFWLSGFEPHWRQYTDTLIESLGDAVRLNYSNCGWVAEDISELCEVLVLCHKCRFITLASNYAGDEGVCVLVQALGNGLLPELHELNLFHNRIGDKGCLALAAALDGGIVPKLSILGFANNCAGVEAFHQLRLVCLRRQISLDSKSHARRHAVKDFKEKLLEHQWYFARVYNESAGESHASRRTSTLSEEVQEGILSEELQEDRELSEDLEERVSDRFKSPFRHRSVQMTTRVPVQPDQDSSSTFQRDVSFIRAHMHGFCPYALTLELACSAHAALCGGT